MSVSPRPHKHPIIRGTYSASPSPPAPSLLRNKALNDFIVNGREKVICVRNLEHNQILQKAELLRNSSGLRLKKLKKPVQSLNESVRGIFSPFHGEGYKV